MGTAGALRDLAEKFKKNEDQGAVGMGSFDALKDLSNKAARRKESLEGITPEMHFVPQDEIDSVRDIQEVIDVFLDEFGDSGDFKILRSLEKKLDRLPLFKVKFSTGDRNSKGELNPDVQDSVYYVTASNVCIRLKKSVLFDPENIREGLGDIAAAVHPFAEVVLFQDTQSPDAYYDLTPAIGLTVKEYFTTTLNAVLRAKDPVPLESKVRIYRDSRGIKDVICPIEARAGVHDGHYVNKIFFTR